MSAVSQYPQLWNLFNEILDEGVKETPAAASAFEDLIDRYQETHRGYHTVEHLLDLAEQFEQHRDLFGKDTKAVIATLLYHDAVYECINGEDEKNSAIYMRDTLQKLGVDGGILDTADRIILATADHSAAKGDDIGQLFLDMDMSILAASPARYDEYLEGVAYEFQTKHGISKADFLTARVDRFLRPTLEKSRIFKTESYIGLEQAALANIRREMQNTLTNSANESAPTLAQ